MSRASGNYWVKTKDRLDKWDLAYWYAKGRCWLLPGLSIKFGEEYMVEVDERPVLREKS